MASSRMPPKPYISTKFFNRFTEHTLAIYLTLVDLLTLCQPCELKLFSHLGGFEPLSLAPEAIVLPIKLSSDIERYDYTSFFLPKVSLILSLIFSITIHIITNGINGNSVINNIVNINHFNIISPIY